MHVYLFPGGKAITLAERSCMKKRDKKEIGLSIVKVRVRVTVSL